MLVTHIEVPKSIDINYIKDMFVSLEDLDIESAKIFYSHYCKSRFPYQESDYDLSNLNRDELYIVDNKESIFIKRYMRKIFTEGIEKVFYPLVFLKKGADFGEDIFCIDLEDRFIIGCAENMRYVNRLVYHRNHLILLAIKMVCKI
jgi:hypothetical protein